MATTSYGGYDYSCVQRDLERFTCSICTKVLRDPHLTGCCGQHYCESCLKNWFTKHHRKSCPHCRAEGGDFVHLLNKSLKREIDSLRIHCTNKEEGCEWIGELGSLKDHFDLANGCDYVEVECPNKCEDHVFHTTKLKRKELANHLMNDCYLRPYQCEHCGYKSTFKFITGRVISRYPFVCHYDKCTEYPLECPNKCGVKNIKRKDLIHHCQHCPEEEVECPNKCQSLFRRRMIKRKDLIEHLNKDCEQRQFRCPHCGVRDIYNVITVTHYRSCSKFPLKCPNKCDVIYIKRKDMEYHRSQCPEEPVRCLFEEAGCKEKLVRRELEQHMSATQQQHLLMVMGAYKEMKKENKEMKRTYGQAIKELKLANLELRQAKHVHQQQIAKLTHELTQLRPRPMLASWKR